MEDNVYFASINAVEIIDKLNELKFDRMTESKSLYGKLSTEKKNMFKFSEQNIASG